MKKKTKQSKTRRKNSKTCRIRRVLQEPVGPDTPVMPHRSNRLASDAPVPHDRCIGAEQCQGQEGAVQVAPDELVVIIESPVQAQCYYSESMSSGQQATLQDRIHRCPTRAMHRCNAVTVAKENSYTRCTSD